MTNEPDELKDFGKPLNTWIEEKVPVKGVSLDMSDEEHPKVRVVEKMVTQRTKYIYAPKTLYRCPRGQHVFKVISTSKYLFGCTKCQYAVKVYPSEYQVTPEGYIIHIRTHTRV